MAASPHVRILAAYITTISDAPLVAHFLTSGHPEDLDAKVFSCVFYFSPHPPEKKNSGRPQAARYFSDS